MLSFLCTIEDPQQQKKVMKIYRRHHLSMVRFAKTRLKNSGLNVSAEDIVQEAFLRITQNIEHIDPDRSYEEMSSYCLTVISHLIIDLQRREAQLVSYESLASLGLPSAEEEYLEQIVRETQSKELAEAISELDEIYQIVLFYRFGQELPIASIAELLNVPENTVKTRLRRATIALSKKLKKEDH